MKKILMIILIFTLVFTIYYFTLDRKVYYVSLGDYLSKDNTYQEDINKYFGNKLERYINYSNDKDYRVIDLIHDIESNKKIIYHNKKYTINNILIKADIITLSIGMNDLSYYSDKESNMHEYIDEVMLDMDRLFILLRRYSKEEIIILNYYGFNSNFLEYANDRLNDVAIKYDIKVIDISDVSDCKLTNKQQKIINNKVLNYVKSIY